MEARDDRKELNRFEVDIIEKIIDAVTVIMVVLMLCITATIIWTCI